MPDSSNPSTQSAKTIRVWDLPVRLFHWLLVVTILFAFLSAEEESALAAWHIASGWVAAVLIAFRFLWGFIGGEHARFADFLKLGEIAHHLQSLFSRRPERSIGHNALGGVAIIALLGTIGGIVWSGVTINGTGGEDLHETLANILLGLIALHVVAVIATSLLTKDNLIGAFVTSNKRADRHPGVSDARSPASLATPIAAIVIGAAAYVATVIYPGAFRPGAHVESGDIGGDETGTGEPHID